LRAGVARERELRLDRPLRGIRHRVETPRHSPPARGTPETAASAQRGRTPHGQARAQRRAPRPVTSSLSVHRLSTIPVMVTSGRPDFAARSRHNG
jgi:hypothetical protein